MAFEKWNKFKDKYSATKGTVPTPEHAEGEGRVMRKVTVKEALGESRKSGNWRSVLSQVAENQTSQK